MCANSEGSGETARMHRLAWAFAGRLCDKYHNLMSFKFCDFQTYKTLNAVFFQHFVSDRKIDEDIGRTTRFLYDDDHLKDVSKSTLFCGFSSFKIF